VSTQQSVKSFTEQPADWQVTPKGRRRLIDIRENAAYLVEQKGQQDGRDRYRPD
jgi:hypothetical protein